MAPRLALLAVLAAAALASAAAANSTLTLNIFGESFSDQGNLFNYTNGTVPRPALGYWKGRFTNAPGVWADRLNSTLGNSTNVTSYNFAFGGSTACAYPQLVSPLPTVLDQAQLFAASVASNENFSTSSNSSIAIIWAGTGDIVALSSGLPVNVAITFPATIPPCIQNAAEVLMQSQLFTAVLIAGLPPIDLAPFSIQDGVASQIAPLVQAINSGLTQVVLDLQAEYTNQTVLYWDVASDMTTAINNATLFNNSNAVSCLNASLDFDPFLPSGPGVSSICQDPDSYFFYDGIHPTSAGHKIIAESLVKLLATNGIFTPQAPASRRMVRKHLRLRAA